MVKLKLSTTMGLKRADKEISSFKFLEPALLVLVVPTQIWSWQCAIDIVVPPSAALFLVFSFLSFFHSLRDRHDGVQLLVLELLNY